MMLFYLTAILLPSAILGQCCMPDQISGELVIVDHLKPSTFVVDFTKHKLIAKPIFPEEPLESLLADFNTETLYARFKAGFCIKTPFAFPGAYQQCIPKNATDLEVQNNVDIDSATWHQYSTKEGTTVSMTVSDQDCLPWVADLYGPGGQHWEVMSIKVEKHTGPTPSLDVDNSDCVGGEEV